MAEAGCLWLLVTGGEVLLRPDFVDVYRYAKRKGFLISLFTNGTLLTPSIVELLADWYPFLVEITLYGMSPETYGAVTGEPRAYERCIRGIEMLVEADVPLRLKAIAMTLNRHELPMMYDYAASLGVDFRHDGSIWPTLHGRDIRGLRLAPDEVVELDSMQLVDTDKWAELYERTKTIVQEVPGNGDFKYDPGRLLNCGGGLSSFHIDAYGQLGICQLSDMGTFDLTTGSFEEGWRFLGSVRSTPVRKDYACLHCDLTALCHRCPAFSALENGDPETPVEHACELACLRAQRHGVPAELATSRT
jgi:radical SAM protein with 4Fe4S-binding SPASM domain